MERLIGKKITNVRPMTPEEKEIEGWEPSDSCICIELENGAVIYPACDPESNGPGALFVSHNSKNFIVK